MTAGKGQLADRRVCGIGKLHCYLPRKHTPIGLEGDSRGYQAHYSYPIGKNSRR